VRLLVSLCSRTDEAPECLVVCDPERRSVRPVAVPDPAFGTFGLAVTPVTVYALFDLGRPVSEEPERSELRALDPATLRLRWRYPFEVGRDVHSIAVDGEAMHAVSTGTDDLLRIGLDLDGTPISEEVAWRLLPDAEHTDRHHLNDVAFLDGRLLISGFGPRPGPTVWQDAGVWQDARDGFVRSVGDGSVFLGPLYHPHSICQLGPGEFAVCESPRRRVLTNTGRSSDTLPGYARGLCAAAGKLYVGTSRDRHPSEPPSILPYDRSSTPTDDGVAAICELDLATFSVQQVIELSPYGREVYDIIHLS